MLPRAPKGETRPNALGHVDGLSREAIEALPVAVYMTDAEGRLIFYNEAASALWGRRPKLGECMFCGSWKLYWPDGTALPHEKCPMAIALNQRRAIRGIETIAERPDGTRTSFIAYPTPLFDATGRLTGAINVLVDIGDDKRAETHLAERNAQLDLAEKIARIGSFTYDHATQKLQLSPGCVAIYGLPDGTRDISREDWRALVHPDDLSQLDALTRRALAHCETELILEFRILRHGEVRWIESRVLILYNEVGRALRRIGAEVDVTERKRVELALAERNTQIELASKTARVGSLAIDFHSGLVKLSPGCATILGLPESTVEVARADLNKLVHPEDLASLELRRDQAVLKQQREFIAQFRIRRANDGEVRWIEARSVILYDQSGKPTEIVGVRIDFTDRKLAADILAERNLQLELAGEVGRVGSYAYDVSSEKLQVFAGYAALYGLPEGTTETTLSEWRARVHPEDLGQVEGVHDQAVADKRREYRVEYRIIRSDGEVRWTERRCFISYDSDARPQRVVGVSIDITERKLSELALAERDAQLALAGEAALVGSYAYESDLERMTVSEGYAAMHGLPEGTMETTRSEWRTRVHPDDLERLEGFRARTFGDRRHIYNIEYRIVRASGEVRWIESRSIISYDDNGRPRRVIGINIDVTQRKQTEALLKESETRLSDALAAGHVVAFEWDTAAGRSRRSDNADRIIGLVDGGRFLWQVHADDRGRLLSLIRGLSLDNPSYALTFRFIRADGHQVWLEETAKGEFDAAGRLLRIKGLTRDITERKELEDHKNTLISELDHRVKNVLAAVSAVASRTQETSSSMAEFVAALDGRIKSMATTHQLLSHRHWHGIPLAELVRCELAPYATAKNTRIDGSDVVLNAEAGQTLAMVFHELATNAAKFGAISVTSGHVSVRWSLRRNGHAESWLYIHWEESGGPRVVPPTRSGFGTSVVRELIPYELGGRVDVMHPAEGVRVQLEIPGHWLNASIPSAERQST